MTKTTHTAWALRTGAAGLVGALVGFFVGMMLSEVVGILGWVLTRHAVGVPLMSLWTALGGMAVGIAVSRRRGIR